MKMLLDVSQLYFLWPSQYGSVLELDDLLCNIHSPAAGHLPNLASKHPMKHHNKIFRIAYIYVLGKQLCP